MKDFFLQNFWTLAIWLSVIGCLWLFKETVSPVVRALMDSLAAMAHNNGLLFIVAVCLAVSACASAFYDNFASIDRDAWAKLGWWQVACLFMKSLSPAFSTVAALFINLPAVRNVLTATGNTASAGGATITETKTEKPNPA
jgi:hypothetical protein